MKILVTGGAGFIGSHIVDAYIKAGHDVALVDNLSTGFRNNLNPRARFYEVDIRNLAGLRKVFAKEKPEIVNHHAAIAAVTASLRDPVPTMEVNVLGTTNVCLCAGEFGARKFLFASTGGALYGDFDSKLLPVDESFPPDPVSPYGLSKALSEEVVKFYGKRSEFPYLIFRYANVYGPRQNPRGEAGVVAIFSELMREGKQPTIFGDGTKTRDYVYVEDVVRANTLALSNGEGECLNIGLGKEITDQEMFDVLARELQYAGKPAYAPFREGEISHIALDASRAKKILGWEPKVTLQEGIARTLTTP